MRSTRRAPTRRAQRNPTDTQMEPTITVQTVASAAAINVANDSAIRLAYCGLVKWVTISPDRAAFLSARRLKRRLRIQRLSNGKPNRSEEDMGTTTTISEHRGTRYAEVAGF